MDSYPLEAWQRLGSVLASRRGQLGYGFRQRAAFAEANELRLSARTLQRLEGAERDAYPKETLAVAETMYRLAPGSIVRVLRGGEPVFADAPDENYADELVPECDYERFLAAKGIEPRLLLERFRAHRAIGHDDACLPPAKPGTVAIGALQAR
jgi:hypothetical protein